MTTHEKENGPADDELAAWMKHRSRQHRKSRFRWAERPGSTKQAEPRPAASWQGSNPPDEAELRLPAWTLTDYPITDEPGRSWSPASKATE